MKNYFHLTEDGLLYITEAQFNMRRTLDIINYGMAYVFTDGEKSILLSAANMAIVKNKKAQA